jgi:hypothetical protein
MIRPPDNPLPNSDIVLIMSLFAAMDVHTMETQTLQGLIAICSGMLSEAEAERHRTDYQDFLNRLSAELRGRGQAATKIQSVFRGNQGRKGAEHERELQKQTKASIAIQNAFRVHQAKNTLKALREQQAIQVQQALEAKNRQESLQKADTLLQGQVNPALVSVDQKLEVARLLEAYQKAQARVPAKAKNSSPQLRAARAANSALDSYIEQIIHLVQSALEAQQKQLEAAITVNLPADFRQNGAARKRLNFLFLPLVS